MQEETEVIVAKGPGEKLKYARESFGFTVGEAASQLYLPERVIKALEEDDYQHSKLPARAFIRGYLRSYSKLLKLSPDEILSDFDALGIYKIPTEEVTNSLNQSKNRIIVVHRDKFWFLLVGGTLFAVLVLIIGLIWSNNAHQEKNEDALALDNSLEEIESEAENSFVLPATTVSKIENQAILSVPMGSVSAPESERTSPISEKKTVTVKEKIRVEPLSAIQVDQVAEN